MVSHRKKRVYNSLYMVWNARDMLIYLGNFEDVEFDETTKLICTRASVGANIKR